MRLLRVFFILSLHIYFRPICIPYSCTFLPLDAFPIMFYFRISPVCVRNCASGAMVLVWGTRSNRNLFVHSFRILTNKYLLTATMDWIWIYL